MVLGTYQKRNFMNALYFLLLLSCMTIIYFIIGWISSKKILSVDDYFLANRSTGILTLTFALVGSQLGSGMLLGTAEKSYFLGMWGIMYILGISLGFVVLGLGVASRLRALNISTTAEIFSKYYQSPHLKLIASAISIVSLLGILVAQIVASSTLFAGLHIADYELWLLAFWFMLVAYTMLGGLRSIMIIDTMQVAFILLIFSFIFIKTAPISFAKLFSSKLLGKVQGYFFSKNITLFSVLPTLVTPILFSLIEQDLAQKFFAAKSKATATISAFLAAILITGFACIPMYLGIFAKYKGVKVALGVSPLIPLLEKICSELVFALAICAIIAAIASTSNSILCAISSNITQDFSRFLPQKNSLFVAKIVTAITGCTALFIAFAIESDVISVLEHSYRISIGALFIPTVIAYFTTTHLNKMAATLSILFGLFSCIACMLYMPYSIYQDLLPLGMSLLGYLIGMLWSHKKVEFIS